MKKRFHHLRSKQVKEAKMLETDTSFLQKLLMKFMKTRANNTQEQLAALFDVDQTTVYRYLQLVGEILNAILPTSDNISNYIQSGNLSKDQLKRIMPDNVLIIDGTHVPIQRPEDSEQRAESYSGKKEIYN